MYSKNRVITGFAMGICVFLCILLGKLWLLAMLLVFVVLSACEYVNILKNKGFFPFLSVILTVSIAMILISAGGHDNLIPFIVVIGTISSFLAVLFRGRQPYIANAATTVLGFLIAWMPCYICMMRHMGRRIYLFDGRLVFEEGLYYLIFAFFVILMTDISAYYFGIKFGKHKLSPVISPKKSIEGSAAGSISAVLTGIIIGKLIDISLYQSVVLSIIITVMAQLGDLSESLIKRDAGVKDSGHSLPGHGGFLDRADSYLFSIPAAYYYIKYFMLEEISFPMISDFIEKVRYVIAG